MGDVLRNHPLPGLNRAARLIFAGLAARLMWE
jgi:hypothetical protein